MSIGYACLTVGVPYTDQKSCIQKYASDANLYKLIAYNLNSLENIIDYNIANEIKLFRISSDLIPFASSQVNMLIWWDLFSAQFARIGKKIRDSNMRVSMHPGQYTVLNSIKSEVVTRAIDDLIYHTRVLDCLGLDSTHKIVLHIGGVYGEKNQAKERFIENIKLLDVNIKQRLVIENDDKSYHIADVLGISGIVNIPVVFDNLHNAVNPSGKAADDVYWIEQCKQTWRQYDGIQKIHYSQQDKQKRTGSHSQSVAINEFIDFYYRLGREDVDIMLEVKDKNISAIKCINCVAETGSINKLELEWSRYKYIVLEKSKNDYDAVRGLLKNKNEFPAIQFYNIIESALLKETKTGDAVNAAAHVWGYFKECATEKEKTELVNLMEAYKHGETTLQRIKRNLWKLALTYNQRYLLDSYYFLYS